MRDNMKSFFSLNRWDWNFILTMVGFGFFTTFVDSSLGSIAFRGFALIVALLCLKKTKIQIPKNAYIKAFLFVFVYISLQVTVDFYLLDSNAAYYSYTRMQSTLYNWGIVGIPMLAFMSGFKNIQWDKTLVVLLLLLTITVGLGVRNTFSSEMTNDGRFNMNARVSTLQFGDNAAYLVILGLSIILKSGTVKDFKILRLISYIAVVLGVWGVAKAGSRGPLVGMCAGVLFLYMCISKKGKGLLALILCIVLSSGLLNMKVLESFAPALVKRFADTVEDGDLGNRDILFDAAMQKFSEGINWLIGSNPYYLELKEFSSCHNMYLEMLVGTGVIGFVVFLYSTVGVGCMGYIRRRQLVKRPEAFFLFGLLFFNLARGLSGIMVIANPILAFSVIGAAYYLRIDAPYCKMDIFKK